MPRIFDIYKYRGDNSFDNMIKPIRSAFLAKENITKLKRELDRVGAGVTEASLADQMDQVYISDDDIQRAELLVATGEVNLQSALARLNATLLATLQRKLGMGGQLAHDRFLDTAKAFLEGNQKRIYTYFSNNKTNEYTRQDIERHPGYMDMYRFNSSR